MKINVACAVIIESENKVLLVKEKKESAKGKFCLPCGKLEFGEELTTCAKREALEEAGIEIEITKLVGIYQRPASKENTNTVFFVFAGRINKESTEKSYENLEKKYFSLNEIKQLHKEGRLRIKITLPAIIDYFNKQEIPLNLIKPIY